MGKLLAIDWGTRKIGLAISDTEQQFAFPYQVLDNEGFDLIVQKLSEICRQEAVKEIIVGLPTSLSGAEKVMAWQVRDFVKQITKKISLPVSLVDERMTTAMARRQLKDKPSVDQKDDIQMESARIILEDVLKQRRL